MTEWAPFATPRPGPPSKVGYSFPGETGPKRGDVKHSADGWWGGIHSVLDGPRAASWQFTVGFDRVEQHYPLSAHCWHAGDVDDDGAVAANIDLVGIEHLGKENVITPYQTEMTARITRFSAEQFGRNRYERFDGWSPDEPGLWLLVEHNEVSDDPTSCPWTENGVNRILWDEIFRILNEEDDEMAALEEVQKLREEMRAVNDLQNEFIVGNKTAVDFLAEMAASHEERITGLAEGTTEVDIWPVGKVKLSEVRHRGYHAQQRLTLLRTAVQEARATLENHITIHNQSGGAIDRTSGEFLKKMSDQLDALDGELVKIARVD